MLKDVGMPVQALTRTVGLLPRPPENVTPACDHANDQALTRTDGLLPRPPENLKPACGDALLEKFVTLCGKPEVYAALLDAG